MDFIQISPGTATFLELLFVALKIIIFIFLILVCVYGIKLFKKIMKALDIYIKNKNNNDDE